MADRVGVITRGELILVEDKVELMRKLGKKELTLQLVQPLAQIPQSLQSPDLSLSADGLELTYTYDAKSHRIGMAELLAQLAAAGIAFKDLNTHQSSLEDIFVSLVHERSATA
jgi:ABC-2 type transport system ATP-binding protein